MTLRTGRIQLTNPSVVGEQDETGLGLWIVQFSGPVQEAWKRAVTARGVVLGDYLPDFAFLAQMESRTARQLSDLPFVAGVGRLQPQHKIDPALQGQSGQVAVRVLGFRGQVAAVQRAARSFGAQPLGGGAWEQAAAGGSGAGSLTVRIAADQIPRLAADPGVTYLEPVRPNQLFNDKAAEVIGVPTAGWEKGLDGSGQVVAVADTGLDTGDSRSMHPDLASRIEGLVALGRTGDASDPHGHGTHVAGSILGTGAASGGQIKGMAPGARLFFQSVLDAQGGLGGIPSDLGRLLQEAYDAGARIHSDSWGVPYSSGGATYDAQAQGVDRFIWEHPEMAVLFAAGNDGDHNQDGRPNYGTVSTPGTAKNAITVGASENARPEQGKYGDNPEEVALFSSRGLTTDGRVKPDVVAPGSWILSTKSSQAPDQNFWKGHDSRYAYMGGTSMATPVTAGATAVLRQFFTEQLGITPRAALLKAALINGGLLIAGDRRDHGWGRVDLRRSLDTRMQMENESVALNTGEKQEYTYTVGTGEPLRITLVWTDYPATPGASKALVNDLDLEVVTPDGQTLQGNRDLLGLQGPDRVNNVENIRLTGPQAGTYTIRVKAYNVPQGPQRYALVVTGDLSAGGTPPPLPPEEPEEDETPPTVQIAAPVAEATLRGTVTLAVEAEDAESGVDRVLFYMDGRQVGTAQEAPYRLQWDSRTLEDGTYHFWVRAYDQAGNVAEAGPRRVQVHNQEPESESVTEVYTGGAQSWGSTERLYFTAGAGEGRLQLRIYGWLFPSITIYGPRGEQVATASGYQATQGVSLKLPREGLYLVLLNHRGGYGNYKLELTHPGSAAVRSGRFTGTVTAGGSQARAQEVLVVGGPGALNLSLAWQGGGDLDLYLVDGSGQTVAQADSPNRNPETLSLTVSQGTYRVVVVADSGTGRYTLTARMPR